MRQSLVSFSALSTDHACASGPPLDAKAAVQIAFYAPLKSPGHPVPSGDRLMARLLISALQATGASVEVASSLRTFSAEPAPDRFEFLHRQSAEEVARLINAYACPGRHRPDVWFTYHPYYKAPDWIGTAVADTLGIPYVTAEASYASRRAAGPWQAWTAAAVASIRRAAVNICLTERDRAGLDSLVPPVTLAMLPPFIDTAPYRRATPRLPRQPAGAPVRLVTVAMMRPGEKFQSYELLAAALTRLHPSGWHLDIIGDGPERAAVVPLFQDFPAGSVTFHGLLDERAVAARLAAGDIYVWPGVGEGFGLAYLEAQACGLPVVAMSTAGVGSVVEAGRSGHLVPFADDVAFAAAVQDLIDDVEGRRQLGSSARCFVLKERSLQAAASSLREILRSHLES